jgi:hypothetical protein
MYSILPSAACYIDDAILNSIRFQDEDESTLCYRAEVAASLTKSSLYSAIYCYEFLTKFEFIQAGKSALYVVIGLIAALVSFLFPQIALCFCASFTKEKVIAQCQLDLDRQSNGQFHYSCLGTQCTGESTTTADKIYDRLVVEFGESTAMKTMYFFSQTIFGDFAKIAHSQSHGDSGPTTDPTATQLIAITNVNDDAVITLVAHLHEVGPQTTNRKFAAVSRINISNWTSKLVTTSYEG